MSTQNKTEVKLPAVDNTGNQDKQGVVPTGKLIALAAELLGLEEGQLFALGIWGMANQHEIIKRLKKAVVENQSEAVAFDNIFEDAPFKPTLKDVISNIEAKFYQLFDKLCLVVDAWLGRAIGDRLREGVSKSVAEFKKSGENTNWAAKADLVKNKLNSIASEVKDMAKESQKVLPAIVPSFKKEYPKGSPFNMNFC